MRGQWSALTVTNILIQLMLIVVLIRNVFFWPEDAVKEVWNLKVFYNNDIYFGLNVDLPVVRVLIAMFNNAVCSVISEALTVDKSYNHIAFSLSNNLNIYRIVAGDGFDLCPASEDNIWECAVASTVFAFQIRHTIALCLANLAEWFIRRSIPWLNRLDNTIRQMNRHPNGRFSAFTVSNMIFQVILFGTLAQHIKIWFLQTDDENLKTFHYQFMQFGPFDLTINWEIAEIIVYIYTCMLLSLIGEMFIRVKHAVFCFYTLLVMTIGCFAYDYYFEVCDESNGDCTIQARAFFIHSTFVIGCIFGRFMRWLFEWMIWKIIRSFAYLNSTVPAPKVIKLSEPPSKEYLYLTKPKSPHHKL